MVSERDVVEALSRQLNMAIASAADYPELPILEERVSVRFIKESKVLPLHEDNGQLVLAMLNFPNRHRVCSKRVSACDSPQRRRAVGRANRTGGCV